MLNIHSDAASIFEHAALDAFTGSSDDHLKSALLSGAPHIRGFATQSGFLHISVCHADNYILHLLFTYAKIALSREVNIEGIEKWATPTFLLVYKETLRSKVV